MFFVFMMKEATEVIDNILFYFIKIFNDFRQLPVYFAQCINEMRDCTGRYFTIEFTDAITDILLPGRNLLQHLAQLLLQLFDILLNALALILRQLFKLLRVESFIIMHRCQCKTGRCSNEADLLVFSITLDILQRLFLFLAEFFLYRLCSSVVFIAFEDRGNNVVQILD